MALNRTLAALAFLASAIVLVMVAAIIATGFSQEFFELAPSPAFVADQLRDQPAHALGLRINLGLDNLFIVIYSAFFVLLAVRLRTLLSPVTIAVALAAPAAHVAARCARKPSHSDDVARLCAWRADLS